MDLKNIKKDSDASLVKRLKNKEERAFVILVDKYKSPLFYFIYRIVGNTMDAEDLTMITFTKVFTGIDNYLPDFLFSTWLFRIARNASFDFIKIKKHNIYGDIDLELLKNYIDSRTPNPEEIIINDEKLKILKRKVKYSNPKFREIIILRTMFGYTFREIEQKHILTINSGSQHMYRARAFFRETLD